MMLHQTLLLLSCALFGLVQSHEDILVTKLRMDISWSSSSPDATEMSVRDLFSFSKVVSPYITKLMQDEHELDETAIFDTTVDIRNQAEFTNERGSKKFTINADVTLWYLAHEPIENFAFRLEQSMQNGNGIEEVLKEVSLLSPNSKNFLVAVTSLSPDTQILYSIPIDNSTRRTKSLTGLVVACVMLVLALVFVSSVLVWMAGGCPVLWEKILTIYEAVSSYCCCVCNKEEDEYEKDDSATTASGILGAVPSYDSADSKENKGGMPAGFTPSRGVFREQDCDDSQILSPVSTNTDFSSSRMVPLGIASKSSLTYRSPDKQQGATSYLKPSYINS